MLSCTTTACVMSLPNSATGLAWVVNSRWGEGLRLMVPEAGQPTTWCPMVHRQTSCFRYHSDLSTLPYFFAQSEGHWWFCSSDGRDAQTHLQRPQVQGLGVGLHSTGYRDLWVLGNRSQGLLSSSSSAGLTATLQQVQSHGQHLPTINLTLVRCAARALLSHVGTQTPEG